MTAVSFKIRERELTEAHENQFTYELLTLRNARVALTAALTKGASPHVIEHMRHALAEAEQDCRYAGIEPEPYEALDSSTLDAKPLEKPREPLENERQVPSLGGLNERRRATISRRKSVSWSDTHRRVLTELPSGLPLSKLAARAAGAFPSFSQHKSAVKRFKRMLLQQLEHGWWREASRDGKLVLVRSDEGERVALLPAFGFRLEAMKLPTVRRSGHTRG
jgi:hypothetical protein